MGGVKGKTGGKGWLVAEVKAVICLEEEWKSRRSDRIIYTNQPVGWQQRGPCSPYGMQPACNGGWGGGGAEKQSPSGP